MRNFALTDFSSDSTLNIQAVGLSINLALGKHQTRISFSLEFITGAHPSSHPGFKSRPFCVGGVCIATNATGSNLFRCRPQWKSTIPDNVEWRLGCSPFTADECLAPDLHIWKREIVKDHVKELYKRGKIAHDRTSLIVPLGYITYCFQTSIDRLRTSQSGILIWSYRTKSAL